MTSADRLLLLAFAVTQAILYSSLMPLWEGFDEPWHYGYIQTLVNGHWLPILGQTRLSQEVSDSAHTTPFSHVVQQGRPDLQTFDSYFKLDLQTRQRERFNLERIPRKPVIDSGSANYEIQQAPLAYAVLAPVGFVLQNTSIPVRILWLRIANALVCALATFAAAGYFYRMIGLPPDWQRLGLFCIFACQMYQATTAHVSSDGIALVLSLWYFSAITDRTAPLRLALVTALGLLTKAYFLPLAAFAICLVAWRSIRSLPAFAAIVLVIAGPWYARNLLLYHNLSGLLMSSAGISPLAALAALPHVDWPHTIPYMLRATLWTGNNSFTTFSAFTLNCLLTLLAVGFVLYLATKPKHAALLGGLATFAAAVIYVVGNDVIFQHGRSAGASPWYTIPLFAPLVGLALLGMSRAPRVGRPFAIGIVCLSAYICIATYVVKLIPLYGGYPEGRSTLRGMLEWYSTQGRELTGMLSTISLAPPALIYFETGLVSALAITLAARLC